MGALLIKELQSMTFKHLNYCVVCSKARKPRFQIAFKVDGPLFVPLSGKYNANISWSIYQLPN